MKKSILALAVATIAVNAMAGKTESKIENLKVNDLQLYTENGEMHIAFDLDMSNLKVGKNNKLIYTPIFAGANDSVVLEPIVVMGRNVQIKEERETKRRTPGAMATVRRYNEKSQTVKVDKAIPYAKWMDESTLSIAEDLCGCGILQEQERMQIGSFDNRPPQEAYMTYVAPKAEAVKARAEKGSAFVDYVVNKTNILPDYRSNRKEIAKIVKTIDLVKNDPNVSITEINIHGFASPEGSYANNTRLAEGRAASLKEYVESLYTLPDKLFTSAATPEDWAGLRKLVADSEIEGRDEILALIDNTDLEPDAREGEIKKKFPKSYAYMLSEWYPGLRHSDYTVSYIVRPFTVEETKEIMLKNPRQVSLNEMFLVAKTMTPGSEEFNKVMDIAVATYPQDETANLNAACAAISADDYVKAARYLKKAGNSAEADAARGVLAMKEGRYDEAEKYLKQAQQGGVEAATENLQILARLRHLATQNR